MNEREALIPTMELRWAQRLEPFGDVVGLSGNRFENILQQRFNRVGGGHVWVDVPVVMEENNDPSTLP